LDLECKPIFLFKKRFRVKVDCVFYYLYEKYDNFI
jgi:hypothetical protein